MDRIIDLTYSLSEKMLVYPGNDRPVYEWRGRFNSEGYNLTKMSMLVHTGTHVDSPLHFTSDGESIDRIGLERFYGETQVFRLKSGKEGKAFGPEDIEPSIDSLDKKSIFLIETGVGKYAETSLYNSSYSWPSPELVSVLVEKEISCYMTDATAVDPVGSPDSTAHKTLFAAGIPIVENLANLEKLPDKKKILISALPLKLEGREGAPCRAVAII